MVKVTKRVISMLLVMVMALSITPIIASAETVASGTCGADGDNLTWTLDSEGTLTISGKGDMEGDNCDDIPWYSNKDNIKKVIIENGVTSIGRSAFEYCDVLTTVTIPNSVTVISALAFYNCDSLTSITIPNSVTSIENDAFFGCNDLADINMPNSVAYIGRMAFDGTAYYTNESNWDNNILYIGNYLIEAENCISGNIDIKQGTVCIGYGAFSNCSDLTSITIPNSVMSIGIYAFNNCVNLTDINIPDSVTKIGCCAFSDTAYYKNDLNWEKGVLYIGNHLIDVKSNISGNYEIKKGTICIGDSAFSSCYGLTSVTIPDSVTSIGDSAFSDCFYLRKH